MHTATDLATSSSHDHGPAPRHARRGPVLAQQGRLEARLAVTAAEREALHALRYRVFVEEGEARLAEMDPRRGERDGFDAAAAHVIVADRDEPDEVLATCRMLSVNTPADAAASGLFVLETFLVAQRGRTVVEIGRACIDPAARNGRALDMLWRGLWAHARAQGVDMLFGTASLPGIDPRRHAAAIHWLARQRPAPQHWGIVPHPACRLALPMSVTEGQALRTLPPLVRFYWRLGGTFAPEPAADRAFGTTDLAVVIDVADFPVRYRAHFESSAPRASWAS